MTAILVAVVLSAGLVWAVLSSRARSILAVASAMATADTVRPPGEFPIVLEDWGCGEVVAATNENPVVLTCSSPHNLPATTAHGRLWMMHLSGATDSWSSLNGRHEATIVDERHFSINVDASGFGAFEGQRIGVIRGNHELGALWTPNYAGHERVKSRVLPDGTGMEIEVPDSYSSTANLNNCYGRNIRSFSVEQGEAHITLEQAMFHEVPGYVIEPGREVHFRNMNEPSLNSLRYANRGPDREHKISWVNATKTEFRVPVQVADGTYQGLGSNQPAQMFVCPKLMFTNMFLARSPGGYPMPVANASEYAKNGPIPSNANRLHMWVRWGKRIPRRADNGYISTIGTYAKAPADPDPRAERFHFYHQIDPNFYEGRWMQITLNNQPQHIRSASGNTALPLDPMRQGWGYYSAPLWDGLVAEYLSNVTYFYLDTVYRIGDFSGQTAIFGPVAFDRVEAEPDAYVSSITTTYDRDRFGGRKAGYEVTFFAAKNGKDQFDIRYSTEASFKQAGFSSGRDGGRIQGTAGPYNCLIWHSPEMEELSTLWVAIRPRMRIAGVSKPGVSPTILSLWHEPSMADGDKVNVSDVQGATAANRQGIAVQNRPGKFWMLESGLESIEVSDNRGLITVKEPHGVFPGQVVEVFNTPNNNLGRAPWSRFYTVHETPSQTTFTIRTQGVPDGSYAQNPTAAERVGVRVLPALVIDGTANGEYGGSGCPSQRLCDGGGFIVSTEEHKNFTEVPVFRFDPARPVRDQLLDVKRTARTRTSKQVQQVRRVDSQPAER